MSRIRLLLAWLVMAAIPLQGFAAASMLFCGAAAGQGTAVVAMADGPHDHAAHRHGDGDAAGKASHSCATCATCCHSAAITETPRVPALPPLAGTLAAQPFLLILARPSAVPDKPPRA